MTKNNINSERGFSFNCLLEEMGLQQMSSKRYEILESAWKISHSHSNYTIFEFNIFFFSFICNVLVFLFISIYLNKDI